VKPDRFKQITGRYTALRIAVLGDFCLDRYLEIDPDRAETSIETGLAVHNVVNVRPQPGGAGTIVNNLSALGIGTIVPIGFAGQDGEGFELWNALNKVPGVRLDHFIRTTQRCTFTYCKPLVLKKGSAPVELNRLDTKNWGPTPAELETRIVQQVADVVQAVDALVILDQVDIPDTGVVTKTVLESIRTLPRTSSALPILADSRRGLRGYPPVIFKMNASELSTLTGAPQKLALQDIEAAASRLAVENSRLVFISMAERGLLAATAEGSVHQVLALPLRGEIDVVGAGDAVSANLVAALAAGATVPEALELANAAASVVIHKLGTTGAANREELSALVAF
jgi:rfaE bifunctional protein kinase chain/domain